MCVRSFLLLFFKFTITIQSSKISTKYKTEIKKPKIRIRKRKTTELKRG